MERCEVHRELLSLPDYVFPAVMLVIGVPTQQQLERPKPERCGLKHIVHENAYRRMDAEELREMSRSVEEYLKAFQREEEQYIGFYLPELKMADLTNCNAASYTQWTFQEKTA